MSPYLSHFNGLWSYLITWTLILSNFQKKIFLQPIESLTEYVHHPFPATSNNQNYQPQKSIIACRARQQQQQFHRAQQVRNVRRPNWVCPECQQRFDNASNFYAHFEPCWVMAVEREHQQQQQGQRSPRCTHWKFLKNLIKELWFFFSKYVQCI